MYSVTRLPNGLTVATAEMPHMASASVGLWIGVGSRYETPDVNGVCHFIEHLLFKGTRRRSAREISQAVEGIGGYLNAFTSEEFSCFHARAGHDRFDELLDVLVDMRVHSRFAPEDVAKERQVIKEEVAMYIDQPQQHVQELLNATLWPGQPLGRPITGTHRSLDALDRPQLTGFMGHHYLPGNTFIVAAGRLTHRRVVREARRHARHFRPGPAPAFVPARNEQTKPGIRLCTRPTEQTHLALGIRTCSRHDRRRHALRLLNTLLGENMSSRLFQIIREDLGLAYSIYSATSFFHDTGDLVISASLDSDKLARTLRLIVRELRRVAATPPSRAELRRACDYSVGQIDLALESTDNQMNWAGEQLSGYGRILRPAEVKRRLHQVTAGEVRAVARDFFRPNRFNLALVGPRKSGHDLKRLLEN